MSNPETSQPKTNVFIKNTEEVLVPGGHATDSLARRVTEISPRAIWYGAEATVLPTQPDPRFVDYVASMGRESSVIVPAGIDSERLSIRDGFVDPALQVAVKDKTVESYIGDHKLGELISKHGGTYVTGGTFEAVEAANDKGRYAEHVAGVVEVPPGELRQGIDAIADTVLQYLIKNGSAFVRHTRSGGGFGNRHFSVNDSTPTIEEIKEQLEGGHPDLWRDGSALVEEVLDLTSSPGVAFHPEQGILYDFSQITQDRDYAGHWSPVPPKIARPEQLTRIGNHLAKQVGRLGFQGNADTDLGITRDGRIYGFEINGRSDGVRHSIAAAEAIWGIPWREWRQNGLVTKAADHFALRTEATFAELHQALSAANVPMATPKNPLGVVINVPPAGKLAGVQVLAEGYEQAETIYRQAIDAVGDRDHNKEDHPLFS